MPTYLLDKNVIRRSIEGIARAQRGEPPIINNFYTHHTTLDHRLRAITQQLLVPFQHARLPELWQPTKALAELP